MEFPVLTPETASADGKAVLEVSQKAYRMIPNLHGVMAGSPALLEAYQALNGIFTKTSLSQDEQHIVWLAVNFENNCHYCMAAHSAIAKMAGLDEEIIDALRKGTPLADPNLETLREFTVHMVTERGWASPAQLEAMESAGYTSQTVLDVVLAIGMKTLSNYTNHLADTPVDSAFEAFGWEKP